MDNKASFTQCKTCKGCGFIKTDPVICQLCEGKKCSSCADSGLFIKPWSLCPICNGDGELLEQ